MDCVTATGLYTKIAGRKVLEYDLDLFNDLELFDNHDNHGYISAMAYCNSNLVICHSEYWIQL